MRIPLGGAWRRCVVPVTLLASALVGCGPFSSPAPTPTPTATPQPTATATATATESPTPQTRHTASPQPSATVRPTPRPLRTAKPLPPTPAPTETPTPTPAATATPNPARGRLTVGVVHYSSAKLARMQRGAQSGNSKYTPYLNPVTAIFQTLHTRNPLARVTMLPRMSVVAMQGTTGYTVDLVQPETHGRDGIWVVSSIRPAAGNTHGTGPIQVGPVHNDPPRISALQRGADSGDTAARAYRNPLLAAEKELPASGFTSPVKVAPLIQAVVYAGKTPYVVVLTQPAKHGTRGIWVVRQIARFAKR